MPNGNKLAWLALTRAGRLGYGLPLSTAGSVVASHLNRGHLDVTMHRSALLLAIMLAFARIPMGWAFDIDSPLDAAVGAPAASAMGERLPPTDFQQLPASEAEQRLDSTSASAGDVSPAAYEEQVLIDDYEPAPPKLPVSRNATRLFERTWYTRIDYFYWAEQVGGATFMQNNGAVPRLGYQQRHGRQRFRAELFGGRVNYFADLGGLDDTNVTDYLGLRGEYELMYEPPTWSRVSFFGGLGSRFFVRSIPDIILNSSTLVDGYQESWWTFYPYLGAESRRTMNPNWEAYWRTRIGITAYTREHVTLNDVTLFPRANLTGQIELGCRGPRFYVSGFCEVMAWSRSPIVLAYDGQYVYDVRQPISQNVMLGLKTGFSY